MNAVMLHKKKAPTHSDLSVIEVKSKFEAEFRRISLKRDVVKNYQAFYKLVKETHRLDGIGFSLWYRDPLHGDLLPINNTENCLHALNVAQPMLRLFVQRQGFEDVPMNGGTLDSKKKGLFGTLSAGGTSTVAQPHNKRLMIGTPQDFRRVSAIIDVDILPDSVRRVRLCKHNSNKPLGFYIRDGTSVRVVNNIIEKCPGIFISRLVPKGLAESTGLLSVNDEVLEVNGIEVAGKSLDQVTDMMVANSHNLIVTVKPVNQESRSDGSVSIEGDNSENANIRRIVSTKQPAAKANGNGNYNGAILDHTMEPIQDSDDEEATPVISDGIVHV